MVEKLTPRANAIIADSIDRLIKAANEGKCKRGNIYEKCMDEIMASPTKFLAEVVRREQGAGAPAAQPGGGQTLVAIRDLWLQTVQQKPEPARLVEVKAVEAPGTSRVQPTVTDWDR